MIRRRFHALADKCGDTAASRTSLGSELPKGGVSQLDRYSLHRHE